MKVKDLHMTTETQPTPASEGTDSAKIYSRVRKIDVTCRLLFASLAVVFVLLHPKGDFPGEVSVIMTALGLIALLATTVRFGMKLENPNRE